ncbi:MAG: uroporphyrinogen-III C-methyltransferase [Tannerellaceae bacterium]|nr:uroporphyrinogen-III C-methyltransferase [Tannerellaceae bacterium]
MMIQITETTDNNYGKVTLVGFGPGDPELLTVAGQKALQHADIIFYDHLVNIAYLKSLQIELVYVGKRAGDHSKEQEEINQLLLQAAIAGKNVVRVKGGDPMIFAHGGEEVHFLESHQVKVEVIPGVTTACALSATSKISLTRRGIASSVAFVSGHSSKLQTPDADTLVYYMGANNLPRIAQELLSAGRRSETPVLLMYNVSLPDQQEFITTLSRLKTEEVKYPTPLIMLVGEVIHTRKER